jgi:hypothetical protein
MKARIPMGGRRILAQFACGAIVASFAFTGTASADTDNIVKTGQVNVPAISMSGGGGGVGCTPTSFSFDISWIDPFVHAYFLADRTHGGASNGDILMIDLSDSGHATKFLTPPASDPFAGIRCDKNADFGGSAAAGRNEITGPNGVFTVNHAEAWVGDGPSDFTFGQTNKAVDYINDKCDSSVRVFNLATGQQTDHINIGGCFRTDEGAFDPDHQVALFANPAETDLTAVPGHARSPKFPFISLISTIPVAPGQHHKILKKISFDGTHGTVLADGGIEQPVYSHETGLFYIATPGNLAAPGDGWITVVSAQGDADDMRVVRNIPTPGCNPHGLALGPDNELYLGCNSGPQRIMDARSGHILKVITQTVQGCDEVTYNAGDNHFVGACSDNNAPGVFGFDQIDADPIAFDQGNIPTAPGAHSIAADPVTVTNWIPAFGGVCGTGVACVAIYGSTGGDDESEFVEEREEDHHHDRDRDRDHHHDHD